MKILFAGTPEFAATHLRALLQTEHEVCAVITQPDKPGKRGKQRLPSPVKKVAEAAGLPVIQPKKLAGTDIAGFKADLMLVVAYGQIVGADVLATPALGCINIHASLLPRWRGAAPIQHAILAGDETTGVTFMQMDEGMDTGAMLARREIALSGDETSQSLAEKLAALGAGALPEVLEGVQNGALEPEPQDHRQATHAGKIAKQDARLDWSGDAEALARRVRAFNPDPVAWTLLGELRIRIWFARPIAGAPGQPPGTIVELSKAGVTVACGEGRLLVSSLQLPIGKGSILHGTDILNARKDLLAPGKRFD